MLELVSLGAHLWSLDVDGWRIPCRTERGWCSSGMSIKSAIESVDARCLHYIIWEVVPGVYHTLCEGLLAYQESACVSRVSFSP